MMVDVLSILMKDDIQTYMHYNYSCFLNTIVYGFIKLTLQLIGIPVP